MVKYKNDPPRPVGSGGIYPNQEPIKRGVWDLYETTNPRIGSFEVCYWIEVGSKEYNKENALNELAVFLRDNIKSNVVIVEHSHMIVMGGFGSGEAAGRVYLNKRHRKAYGRDKTIDGYEIRLMYDDAVTFMALWRGDDGLQI